MNKEILNIVTLLKFYGVSFQLIQQIIDILKGNSGTFSTIEEFVRQHPNVYNDLSIKAKEKISHINNTDFHDSYSGTTEFIRYKTGVKQLGKIIEMLIRYNTVNIIVLEDILELFQMTVYLQKILNHPIIIEKYIK